MRIDLDSLRDAVRRGVITESEASALWSHLEQQRAPPPADEAGSATVGLWPPRRSLLGMIFHLHR